jgi:hypothetical protein
VDVFSSNAGYRGLDFSNLFTGDPSLNFSGWTALSKKYNKPFFISEAGWNQLNHSINEEIPNWFNELYSATIENEPNGLVGMAFSEYSDQPAALANGATTDPLLQSKGVVHPSVAVGPGGSSIDPGVLLADDVTPNAFIYESLENGTYNNIPYNFNTPVFTGTKSGFALFNRSADTLTPAQCTANMTSGNETISNSTTTSNSTHSGISLSSVLSL